MKLKALLLAAAFALPAHAEEMRWTPQDEITAMQLLEAYQSGSEAKRGSIRRIVIAFENGVAWGNTFGADQGRRLLYCTPDQLSLTGSQIVNILREQVKAVPAIGDQRWEPVLILGMQRAFPCAEKEGKR